MSDGDQILEFATRFQRLSQVVCGIALLIWIVVELREHRRRLDQLEPTTRHRHSDLAHRVWLLEHPLKQPVDEPADIADAGGEV